jgi:diaminohydroxyphosphoribosylaminopyrimidine deaminase/5-amino-6-(5-phosphoribosylamino)uracil reductase
MDRALREAHKGHPSPNPHVGAVVARGGELLAVGHHARCGGPHAEVVALQRAGARARGATLYVSFEPCNHHGRTGPCTEAIIAAGIVRVVIGSIDPAPHVPGSSARLRRAGIEVSVSERKTAAEAVVADFTKFMREGIPHVTLKAAITLDGRIATQAGDSKWITSPEARRHAHRLRAQSDAVLVGIATVLADDPELNVRLVRGPNPLRVVLDARLRLPPGSKLANTTPSLRTLVFHGPAASQRRRARLLGQGVELVEVGVDVQGRLRLRSVLGELAKRDIVRLLVEGGGRVHGAFLDAGLADRVAIFIAPRILADADALPFAAGKPKLRIAQALDIETPTVRRFGDDLFVEGNVQKPFPRPGRRARL